MESEHPGDGDDGNAQPLQRACQTEQILRFTTLAEEDGRVGRAGNTQIAMQRVDRMEISGRGTGGGQGRRDFPGDESRLPNPGDDHSPAYLRQHLHGGTKPSVETRRRAGYRRRFERQHAPAELREACAVR